MTTKDFPKLTPKVVLGIVAHADDLDFGVGGSVAKFAKDGAEVHYLILTDGSKGTADHHIDPQELITIRQDEQRQALKILGGREAHFLNYPDGYLEVTMELKRDIVKVIREVKPDVVITWDPSVLYDARHGFINHPDHRAAGQAALDAVFPLARDHLSFPELYKEGYGPHETPTVLMINLSEANYCIDITDTLDTKFKALKAHKSQMEDFDVIKKKFTEFAAEAGTTAECQYAESFVRVDIPSKAVV